MIQTIREKGSSGFSGGVMQIPNNTVKRSRVEGIRICLHGQTGRGVEYYTEETVQKYSTVVRAVFVRCDNFISIS